MKLYAIFIDDDGKETFMASYDKRKAEVIEIAEEMVKKSPVSVKVIIKTLRTLTVVWAKAGAIGQKRVKIRRKNGQQNR